MRGLGRIVISVVFLISFLSCGGVSSDQKATMMQSVPIRLNVHDMECWACDTLVTCRPWEAAPLKLCVFVGADLCTSCYLKRMFQWEDFLELERDGILTIYFIFEPQDGCEESFHKFFYQAELDHPFYLDKNKEFLRQNPTIPRERMFHTFLLDENNKVVLIGDVLHNEEREHELLRILEEHRRARRSVE